MERILALPLDHRKRGGVQGARVVLVVQENYRAPVLPFLMVLLQIVWVIANSLH